ncbi:hypothetical protein TWF281_004366 [Arthrobotrys megalospora]
MSCVLQLRSLVLSVNPRKGEANEVEHDEPLTVLLMTKHHESNEKREKPDENSPLNSNSKNSLSDKKNEKRGRSGRREPGEEMIGLRDGWCGNF